MAVAEKQSPRVLIVRRDNIGDLVCTTPLIEALRAHLPGAWIGALVNTYNAEVLARSPALDAVYAYEKLKHRSGSMLANILGQLKVASRLRAKRLDYVLVPASAPRTLRLAASLKPRQIVAAPAEPASRRHEVERTFALGEAFGIGGTPGPMRVYPDPVKTAELKKRLAPGQPVVAVHISARRPAQRWPAGLFANLVLELGRNAQVMLLWAPGAENDRRHPGDDDKARFISGKAKAIEIPTPDLATLIAALSLADRVVCPDGGAMHLAAALGKPIVALFGDAPIERWRPWQVPHRVVRPPSKDLADLPLAPVLDAYAELASGRG